MAHINVFGARARSLQHTSNNNSNNNNNIINRNNNNIIVNQLIYIPVLIYLQNTYSSVGQPNKSPSEN